MEEIELSEQCRLGNNRYKELYEQYAGRMLASVYAIPATGIQPGSASRRFLKIFDSFDKFTWRVKALCEPGWNG